MPTADMAKKGPYTNTEEDMQTVKRRSVETLAREAQSVLDRGAKLAHENALRHLKAANLLSQNHDYGNGISHLVLAAEEAMKALILFGYRFHEQIPISNPEKMFTEIFHKHQPKQATFMGVVVFLNFLEKTLHYLQNDRQHFVRNMSRLRSQIESGTSVMDRMQRELKSMNKLKSEGFYLDYKNGSWISPSKKTKKTFVRLEEIVSPYVEAMEAIFTLTPEELQNRKENLEKFFSNNKQVRGVSARSR